jgi:putative selenium metabolism protein SsnA
MSAVLRDGLVVTSLSPPRVVRADVTIDGDRVAAVSSEGAGGAESGSTCAGCLIIPGNVCAHHHLYSALARGMPFRLPPPSNFVEILQRVWWRLDRALDEETIELSASVGGAEALLAGTTTVIDHHASPAAIDGSLDRIADALRAVGLRSVLCYEVTDRDGTDRALAGLEENRRFAKEAAEDPLARPMVGAHASFTLSDETLAGCVDVARSAGIGVHIHAAEDVADQGDAEARFGKPVVDRLFELGAVTGRDLLAHCVHVHPSEIAVIAGTGVAVAHNARSNMNNGVGRAPAGALGDAVALGTDGIDGDLFAESKAAYWRAREAGDGVGPQWVLDRLARGASFAGESFDEPLLGRIEPGAPADLVVLDYDPPTPLSADTLAAHWIFGLSAANVRDVYVAGQRVVRDRDLTNVDPAELASRARRGSSRLWERMDDIRAHPFEPGGR